MAESHHDEQVRNVISIISSVTRQCAEVADMTGLESSLWVLVHMGSRIVHAMTLAVEAANARFEGLSPNRQSELLYIVLEVGNRTKVHCAELAKLVDILPDDLRNYLQRWVIIKSFDPVPIVYSPERSQTPEKSKSPVRRTPVAEKSKSTWGLPSWLCSQETSSYIPDCRTTFANGKTSPVKRRSSPVKGGGGGGGNMLDNDESDNDDDGDLEMEDGGSRQGFWKEVQKQMKRIADPDVMKAGLI